MLTIKQVEDLRHDFGSLAEWEERTSSSEVLDTLEALWKVARAAQFILPMAKGYAHEHPVGSNQNIVNEAVDALALLPDGGGE